MLFLYKLTYTNTVLQKARLCYANIKEMTCNLLPWTVWLHIKAEEKTVAFVFLVAYAVHIFIEKRKPE